MGSFNVANFGSSIAKAYDRSILSIVNIIVEMNADLIALQEIEPTEFGKEQVERLVNMLNKAAKFNRTPAYDFVIAEEHTGDETTAFLWRSPVVLDSEISLIEHDRDPDNDNLPAFQREPHLAFFRAGNFDFYLVNCHLYTKLNGTSSEGRGHEFDAIVGWLKELSSESEKDAVVVGDFNRFLNGKSVWRNLMVQDHSQWFRFPLLESIHQAVPVFDPLKDDAPDDEYSTTTSKKKSIYDQIIISKGSDHEFTDSPVFGTDTGIVAFDKDPRYEWAAESWHDAIVFLSDHRPIWTRLRTDQVDDD